MEPKKYKTKIFTTNGVHNSTSSLTWLDDRINDNHYDYIIASEVRIMKRHIISWEALK